MLAPIAALGIVKLAAWISAAIPEGKLKRLLTKQLWRDNAPGRRK